jgi:hypothetical protein
VFQALGRDSQTGQNLPYYFRAAGLGRPDGTDISGILSPMTTLAPKMEGVFRSVLPHALGLGLTTEARSEMLLAGLTDPGRARRNLGALAAVDVGLEAEAARSLRLRLAVRFIDRTGIPSLPSLPTGPAPAP